ncbi:hypothetical protein ES708_18167 [subsurface metagenome]
MSPELFTVIWSVDNIPTLIVIAALVVARILWVKFKK